jgi:hypothetical protein
MSASQTQEEDGHFDVGMHVYEHAKQAWGFGKGLPVIKFFLGTTEAVAGKVLKIGAGKNFEDVDNELMKPGFSSLDTMILNPTITKVLDIVLPAFSKAEDIFKPVVLKAYSIFLQPSVNLVLKLAPGGASKKKSEHPSTKKPSKKSETKAAPAKAALVQ